MQRNCCLTLCNFSIPEELEFQYRRVNELLLSILNPTRQDESIQRIAVHLCNALVCQVDNDHKEAVGKMGFVVVCVASSACSLRSPPCHTPSETVSGGPGAGGEEWGEGTWRQEEFRLDQGKHFLLLFLFFPVLWNQTQTLGHAKHVPSR